nr:G-rich sequence factor 1-like [Saimiri boliviensis boliviensis]
MVISRSKGYPNFCIKSKAFVVTHFLQVSAKPCPMQIPDEILPCQGFQALMGKEQKPSQRGLPYSCNKKDIVDFFAGLNTVAITFVMDYRGRQKTGEAYVQFEEPEMANQALLKHREEIGNRYIEIFPSRRNEGRTHVCSHKGKKMASSPTAKYITEPEMVFEEHEVNEDIRSMAAFESEKEIELPQEMPEKLPEAVDFGTTPCLYFVHMRGLPFQANAQDIINFFAPLKPVRITMEYSSSRKATGEAEVHFEIHEDAVAVMLKDWSHVHHRYIELFLSSCPKGKLDFRGSR